MPERNPKSHIKFDLFFVLISDRFGCVLRCYFGSGITAETAPRASKVLLKRHQMLPKSRPNAVQESPGGPWPLSKIPQSFPSVSQKPLKASPRATQESRHGGHACPKSFPCAVQEPPSAVQEPPGGGPGAAWGPMSIFQDLYATRTAQSFPSATQEPWSRKRSQQCCYLGILEFSQIHIK